MKMLIENLKQDSKSEKITKMQNKKIFESIKKIEDKILKIKLAIDKNK